MKSLRWIAGLYLPCFAVVTAMTGHLSRVGDLAFLFFPFGDGPGFEVLADYYTSSFGQARRPAELFVEVTPFLYPLYLGWYRVMGVTGVQVLQVLMNVLSLWCVYVSVRSLTQRSTIAILCTTALAVTPSFSFLAFYALSETFCILLVCLCMLFLVDHFQEKRQTSLYMATFMMTLLVCIKPIALSAAVVLLMYALITWFRDQEREVWQPIVMLTPVICQMLISLVMTGTVAPAAAGGSVFGRWYFPVVYGQQEYGRFLHRKTPEGLEALSRYPETKDKLMYVVKHYPTAIKTYLSLVVGEHFLTRSSFVAAGIANPATRPMVSYVQWFSVKLNRLFAFIHIFMLCVIILGIVWGRPWCGSTVGLVCYGIAILLFFPMGFVYFQGDKYAILSEPLWLLTYGALAARLADEWAFRFGIRRCPVSAVKH